ncbi:MAG: hypothetical protein OXH52_12500, partial [Gammaproteobacteria bacterium]|nr:hypothetical protein [Gammaproteobacteria bacterium]
FVIGDAIDTGLEVYGDARAGNYGEAAVGAVVLGCDLLKPCKLIDKGSEIAKPLGRALRKRLHAEGPPPPWMKKPQAHHDLPQKFRDQFEARGIDIDDPKYGRWVEGGPVGDHQKWSTRFNQEWEVFLQRNPSAEEIMEQMRDMRKRYR